MARIAAVDFGEKRIGLAVTDPMQMIASPHETILAGKTLEETADKILAALPPDLETILLGLPLHMSGKESPMSEKVRQLQTILQDKTPAKILLVDERLTSAGAERTLKDAGLSRKKRVGKTDTIAALIILQTHLDSF